MTRGNNPMISYPGGYPGWRPGQQMLPPGPDLWGPGGNPLRPGEWSFMGGQRMGGDVATPQGGQQMGGDVATERGRYWPGNRPIGGLGLFDNLSRLRDRWAQQGQSPELIDQMTGNWMRGTVGPIQRSRRNFGPIPGPGPQPPMPGPQPPGPGYGIRPPNPWTPSPFRPIGPIQRSKRDFGPIPQPQKSQRNFGPIPF